MSRTRRKAVETIPQTFVAALFYLTTPLQCRRRVEYPHTLLGPYMVVTFNHSSDLDIPLVVATLIPPRRWPVWPGRVNFIGRSDLFLRGFLGLRFPELGPLRRLLFPLGLAPVLRLLRITPVGKPGPRLVAEWLDELERIYGPEQPAAPLLDGAWLSGSGHVLTPWITLGELRQWRYHALLEEEVGPESLAAPVHRHIRMREARGARERFEEIARPLSAGEPLFMAPEGELSPDGSLQTFRSGVYRLLQRVPRARVLPVGITHDLLEVGRPAAFVRVGSPLSGLGAHSRRACEERLRTELNRLHTVTLPQLAAGVVFDALKGGSRRIEIRELARRIRARADELAATGIALAPDLRQDEPFARRFDRFLARVDGHGVGVRGDALVLDPEALRRPVRSLGDRAKNPLGYAVNQLKRVASGQERPTGSEK